MLRKFKGTLHNAMPPFSSKDYLGLTFSEKLVNLPHERKRNKNTRCQGT